MFIFFTIFFLMTLIIYNLFIKVQEGMSDNKPPLGPERSYPLGDNPPPNPPEYEETQPQIPPAKGNELHGEPSYCGCIDSESHSLYNKNSDFLLELKKKIEKLASAITKTKSQVKSNISNIAKSKKDDLKICCEAAPKKRIGKNIIAGACWDNNKYDCPVT